MKMLPLSIIAVVALTILVTTHTVFAQDFDWKYFVKAGSFWYSNHMQPSQFFKIPYAIENGTIDKLETNNVADIFVDIKSDKEGKFEIKIPKNFPYTNYDFDSRNYMFDILINNVQIDTHIFERQLDCYYVFSLPFKGNSQIKFSFNSDYQSKKPWYGDKVDQKCISETIIHDVKNKSSLIPINFTYPKILQDYDKGIISLPMKHDQYTNFSTTFRTSYDGHMLPYQPTGKTKKELVDDNFQEALKRMSASDLILDRTVELNRTIFKLEQERERAKLLQDDDMIKVLSDKIGVLGQQISIYQEGSKKLWDELNLIQAYNIDLYKMNPEKAQEYEKAKNFLTEKYLNGNNTKPNFVTTIYVDTIKEILVIGINISDKSIDEKQYIAKLSDEIRNIIGNKISFEVQHMEFALLESPNENKTVQKTILPYQQFKRGTALDSTKCDPPLELHIKGPAKPICIKPETYDKLVKLGYPLFS